MMGKTEGISRMGQHRMKQLDGITDSKDVSFSKFWDIVKDRVGLHLTVLLLQYSVVHGLTKSQTQLNN